MLNELEATKKSNAKVVKDYESKEKSLNSKINNFQTQLENEKNNNANEPWSKLDKTAKIKKLSIFADSYKSTNDLSDYEHQELITFFKDCLDRKKLQRVKDVIYNKETGEIKDVPALYYNKPTNHFTLKNLDKRVSTLRGLTPKKKIGTAKNIKNNDSDSENED